MIVNIKVELNSSHFWYKSCDPPQRSQSVRIDPSISLVLCHWVGVWYNIEPQIQQSSFEWMNLCLLPAAAPLTKHREPLEICIEFVRFYAGQWHLYRTTTATVLFASIIRVFFCVCWFHRSLIYLMVKHMYQFRFGVWTSVNIKNMYFKSQFLLFFIFPAVNATKSYNGPTFALKGTSSIAS